MLDRMVEVRNMKVMFTKKMLTMKVLIMLMALMMVLGTVLSIGSSAAYGKDNINVPDLAKDTSKFVLEFSYTDEDVTTPIPGATFTAYMIASVTVKDGAAKYTLTPDFSDLDVDFGNMDAEASFNVADKAEEMVKSKGLEGIKAVSGKDGKADFGDVPNGIYLVLETDAEGEAKKYEKLAPWLVEVPELNGDSETGYSWGYDVVVYPKPLAGKYEEEDDPHYTPPEDEEEGGGDGEDKEKYESNPLKRLIKTGDEGKVFLYAGILIVAIGGLLLAIKKRKASKK